MTTRYQLTKEMRKGLVYKCVNCGDIWSDNNPIPTQYGKLPPYAEISGGLCEVCLNMYFENKRLKNDKT